MLEKPSIEQGSIGQYSAARACPSTGNLVEAMDWKQFPFPNGKLLWWKCPACKGWHGQSVKESTNQ